MAAKPLLVIIVEYIILYIGDCNNPIEGSRIQWNERGILNTAHLTMAEIAKNADQSPPLLSGKKKNHRAMEHDPST